MTVPSSHHITAEREGHIRGPAGGGARPWPATAPPPPGAGTGKGEGFGLMNSSFEI